ncbi:MAG: hypothetical protein CO094_00925 [Anaerolineae bacterium CG_4_9_14_3_um_filter_57_17]|nr:MAG: hypothetical protein CO094_00925 [Anaerolineae bacterium CG_4_9_14_3_um_filter_57_17]
MAVKTLTPSVIDALIIVRVGCDHSSAELCQLARGSLGMEVHAIHKIDLAGDGSPCPDLDEGMRRLLIFELALLHEQQLFLRPKTHRGQLFDFFRTQERNDRDATALRFALRGAGGLPPRCTVGFTFPGCLAAVHGSAGALALPLSQGDIFRPAFHPAPAFRLRVRTREPFRMAFLTRQALPKRQAA